MKNHAFSFAAIVTFLLLLTVAGCVPQQEGVDIENSAIGIMETRGTEKTSRVIFYDQDLNETGSLDLPYATFGGIFYNPLVLQGYLYAIPQGEYDRKNGNMAVRIDLSTLAVDEYRIEQPAMNAIAANGEYIWTCNTINRESFINRCRVEDGSVTSVSVPEEFIMNILWKGDMLYAFGKSMDAADVSVFCYDTDLNLIEKIGIADENLSVYRTAIYENLVYFCGMGADESAGYEGKVGILDTLNSTISFLDLDGKYPSSIAFYHDRLLVSHYDPFKESETDSPFSIIDLKTGDIKHFELDHPVEQIVVKGNDLFVLGGTKIYRYQLENMQLINSVEIEPMSGDFSYISGMFAMPHNA